MLGFFLSQSQTSFNNGTVPPGGGAFSNLPPDGGGAPGAARVAGAVLQPRVEHRCPERYDFPRLGCEFGPLTAEQRDPSLEFLGLKVYVPNPRYR